MQDDVGIMYRENAHSALGMSTNEVPTRNLHQGSHARLRNYVTRMGKLSQGDVVLTIESTQK